LSPPSLESLFVATFALGGMAAGARPIGDNSTFVHLRTGVDMVAGAGIPRTDPYSFTARGHEWVVQSWLPSWIYGMADKLGGLLWVVLLQGVLMALLAWLIARLARTGTPLRTLAAGGLAVGVGFVWWAPRPLLFGLVAMALTVTVVQRRANPWWLVPIVWVWVQSHGSFPLGVLWLGLVFLGTWIDRRAWPADLVRYIAAFAVGLAVACINPLGPKLLTFALTVGEKREVFREVVEWRSPNFQSPNGMFTLVFLIGAIVVLTRYRPRWDALLPAAVFLALALFAIRNMAVFAVVLAPVLGAALRPGTGTTEDAAPEARRPRVNVYFAVVLAIGGLLFVARAAGDKYLDVEAYPVAATSFLQREGFLPRGRVVTQDVVGCYHILRYGRRAHVFIDDRVDMYPIRVSNDYSTMLRGERNTLKLLDRYRIEAVLWDKELPLATVLREASGWRQAYAKGDWVVFVRSGAGRST
jgi:hypothetical protein